MSEERAPRKPKRSINPRRPKSSRRLTAAFCLALLIHIPLLFALVWALKAGARPADLGAEAAGKFSLTVIEEESRLDEAEREKRAREKEREKLEPEREGQFISEAAPEKEETPDEARFLDQFASRAEKETASREPRAPGESGAAAEPTPEPEKSGELSAEPEAPSEAGEEALEAAQEPSEVEPTPREPSEAEPGEAPLDEETPAEGGLLKSGEQRPAPESAERAEERGADARELFPNFANTPAPGGGSESFDYLRDVEEGDKTLLNRKRSRYWSFMQRLKESVAQEWNPVTEYKRRDPHGNVYGVKNRYTLLNMTLNGDGTLRTIYVMHSSGLDFYDKEAVRAIRAAAPFPNPPEGLKDQDGLIQINFGLLLDLSTGRVQRFRIRRP